MNSNFSVLRANGKLLLTGEYLVIDGATAIALPVVFGQSLQVTNSNDEFVSWIASDINGTWFEAKYHLDNFELINSTDQAIGLNLQGLFLAASSMNPSKKITKGLSIKTHLDFNRLMGLGSSSTLIALIAMLFEVDKYKLYSKVTEGSGFDIVCSEMNSPLIFRKISETEAVVRQIDYKPSFHDKLHFVWLGNKQYTAKEVSDYKKLNKKDLYQFIEKISQISFSLLEVRELSTFGELIMEHEELLSFVLKRKTVKKERFSDFNGYMKSLGAWGGDFIMAFSNEDNTDLMNYFSSKGYSCIYKYTDLILNEKIVNHGDISVRF